MIECDCGKVFDGKKYKTKQANHYMCPGCHRTISTNTYDWIDDELKVYHRVDKKTQR